MKVYLVMETFSTGSSHVYSAYSSKKKAKAAIDYIVECCEKDGWSVSWEDKPYDCEHQVRLKCKEETSYMTVGYHLVIREVY